MMKKRIFIAIHYMEIGGAERALLGLLEALTSAGHAVELFVYSHQGELMPHIPAGVRLLPEHPAYALYEKPLSLVLRRGYVRLAAARLWAKVANVLHSRRWLGDAFSLLDEVGRAAARVLPDLHHLGEYDVAISFLMPHYVVRDKVWAKRKIAWIHTDYSDVGINVRRELPVWASYDRIVSISSEATRAFLTRFPSLAPKIVEQENLLPVDLIRREAEAFDASAEMPGARRLLSIGRFCTPKHFPNAVAIMAELCKLRSDVVWYIIGYGVDEPKIREAIERHNMQEKFILLGKRENPYPYIKACDLYVQPSLYEGKAMTVKEAQLLGKPVAITRYPTAAAQVQEGVSGAIIPLEPPAASALALHELLEDAALRRALATQAPRCVLAENGLNQAFLSLLS